MKESEPLELDWLLKCNVDELIASVRPMSAKNCEKIASGLNQLKCWIDALEFDAGIFCCKSPVCLGMVCIAAA